MEEVLEGIQFEVKNNNKDTEEKVFPSTRVTLILDASGSMQQRLSATISGVNEFLGDRRRDKGELILCLTQFNTKCLCQYVDEPMDRVTDVNPNTYTPEGGTALYDAIGTTLKSLDASPAKVDRNLVLIVTDGEENSSQEYNRQQIADMIKEREATGNWTFTYMGSNQDCWQAAGAIGIQRGNIAAYNDVNTNAAWRVVSCNTSVYAKSAAPHTASFYAGEEAEKLIHVENPVDMPDPLNATAKPQIDASGAWIYNSSTTNAAKVWTPTVGTGTFKTKKIKK